MNERASRFSTVDVFQHVPFEDLGAIRAWLDDRGMRARYTRFFAHDAPPPIDDVEALIVLGGPMSVNDEDAWPWLVAEKQFLRDAVTRGVPLLGICLGAQLLADALGSRVYPHVTKEIGWFPIHGLPGPPASFPFPTEVMVFHWHGETFDLPEGAAPLATSEACRNQAFQIADRVIGVQCHLEMTPESVEALIQHCRSELTPAAFVQSEEQLRATPASVYQLANGTLRSLLGYLFEPAGTGHDRVQASSAMERS